jgi:hypothetical protein
MRIRLMLSRYTARACGGLLLFSLMAVSVGCGPNSKARAVVKGKVTLAGKNLTIGSIVFHGKDNLTGAGAINKEGEYLVADAPLGDVKITISVPKPPPGGLAKMRMPGVKDTKSVDPEGTGKSISIMGDMPSHIVPIPEKYAVIDNSGLTYTVVKGEQTHNIDLKP